MLQAIKQPWQQSPKSFLGLQPQPALLQSPLGSRPWCEKLGQPTSECSPDLRPDGPSLEGWVFASLEQSDLDCLRELFLQAAQAGWAHSGPLIQTPQPRDTSMWAAGSQSLILPWLQQSCDPSASQGQNPWKKAAGPPQV